MSSQLLRSMYRLLRDAHRYLTFSDPASLGAFRGVYESFDEAIAAAPKRARIGYDYSDLAEWYRAGLDLRLESSDYPVLFHLQRIGVRPLVVLDFGGNIGAHYLRYSRYLDLSRVKWIVHDLPEIAKVGREVCADVSNVTFVSDIDEIQEIHIDVLHACGSLQYIPSPAWLLDQLSGNRIRPAHLLLNSLPVYHGPRFVTLQNGGRVFYPQYVFNRSEIVGNIEALGFSLVDSWRESLSSCLVPFHSDKSIREYEGFYYQIV
jgi:putative methyltransferase (TIGR04325 family)